MWSVVLSCDGCGADLAWARARPEAARRADRPAGAARSLRREAERLRWERVAAPDGEEWFCPTCRRARDMR